MFYNNVKLDGDTTQQAKSFYESCLNKNTILTDEEKSQIMDKVRPLGELNELASGAESAYKPDWSLAKLIKEDL